MGLPAGADASWELEFLLRLQLDERPPPARPPTSQETEFLLRMALDQTLEDNLQNNSEEASARLIEEAQQLLSAWGDYPDAVPGP